MPWARRCASPKAMGRLLEPVRSKADIARLSAAGFAIAWRRSTRPLRRLLGSIAGRDDADRLCRRALDRGDLHGRGRRAAAISSTPSAWPMASPTRLRRADRSAGREHRRLSRRPRSRPAPRCCSSSTAGPARWRSPSGGAGRWSRLARDHAAFEGASSRDSGDPVSRAAPALLYRDFADRDRGRGSEPRQQPCRSTGPRPSCSRIWRCRAISIRSLLLTGGAALDREVKRILDGLGKGRFVFNLGHGILPETPLAHVERLLELVRKGRGRDDGQARRRAVQSGRARQPGGGRALSLQPVQRSRDHPPAAAAALAARPADLAPAGAGGARDLRPSRRRLAAAGQYRRRRPRRWSRPLAGAADEAKVFIAMRYWHPVLGRGGAARWRPMAPTRSCCCRSIRNFRRRRRHPRSPPGSKAAAAAGLTAPTRAVCCYPDGAGLHRSAWPS